MSDSIKNFVKVTLNTGYDNAATTVVLIGGDGAKLPDPATANFNLVWWNSTDYANPADDPAVEIIRVTGRSTDTLTIVRPVVGNLYNGETSSNTAQNHNTGGKTYKMILAPTYKIFADIDTAIAGKAPTNPLATDSLWDAKGDLAVGTGANTAQKLTVGTDGQILESRAAEATGLKWIAAPTVPVKNSSAEINTGTDDAKFTTAAGLKGSVLWNAPEGFLINGKIVPSVANNDLTVAIKGMDGNDASATNPIYCRIGGVIRSITAACSITQVDGANYFNAGSAELATKEIDWFVYLYFDTAQDNIVKASFSRIPYGTLIGDFSATYNNEKFAAVSPTVPAATDAWVNIGRFAATLSAGAGYTWSVPTFTATNLIQRPIYESRLLSCNLVLKGTTGTIGTFAATNVSWYKVSMDRVFLTHRHLMSNVGSWTGNLMLPLPFSFKSGTTSGYLPLNGSLFAPNTNAYSQSKGFPIVQVGDFSSVFFWGAAAENTYLAYSGLAATDVLYLNTTYPI
jgi:hypothetical protein